MLDSGTDKVLAVTPKSLGAPSIVVVVMLLLTVAAQDTHAQRPFLVYDPFYNSETARRVFFDGYSVTTDISCCTFGDSLQTAGGPNSAGLFGLPLGVGFHFNYQLARQLDIGAVVDAAGSNSGRSLSISWLSMKYYWTNDNADYAFRLAVDPSTDWQVGFPQLDLAFLSTTLLAPMLSNDFAIGARRIRMGYQRWISAADGRDIVFTRALGYEVHAMLSYNLLIDPGGSNVFLSVRGEGGSYSLFETSQREVQTGAGASKAGGTAGAETPTWKTDYRGGVVWIRGGVSFSRPSYIVAPFVSIPVQQWHPEDESHTHADLHAGLRVMLR